MLVKSGKVLLVEYGILGFGIRNITQGIRNPTYDWNSESRIQVPLKKTGIQYLESRIQDYFRFPYMRQLKIDCKLRAIIFWNGA